MNQAEKEIKKMTLSSSARLRNWLKNRIQKCLTESKPLADPELEQEGVE